MYCSVDEITFYSFKNSSNGPFLCTAAKITQIKTVKCHSLDATITADLLELILTFKEETKMVLRALLSGQHWTGFGKISIAVHSG